MKNTNPPKPKFNKSALASVLGISRQALNVHLRKPDHPPIDDIAAWEALLAERGREGTAPGKYRDDIAKARLAILRETEKKLKRENQIAAKELMPVADAIRHAGQAGGFFMGALEKLCREFPPLLSGCNTVEIAQRMESKIEGIRRELKIKLAEIK